MNKFWIGFFRCLVFTIGILVLVPGLLIAAPYWLISTWGTIGMVLSCIIWLTAFCAGGAHLFETEDNHWYVPPVLYMSNRSKK